MFFLIVLTHFPGMIILNIFYFCFPLLIAKSPLFALLSQFINCPHVEAVFACPIFVLLLSHLILICCQKVSILYVMLLCVLFLSLTPESRGGDNPLSHRRL